MRKINPSRRTFLRQSAAVSVGFFGLQSLLWNACQTANSHPSTPPKVLSKLKPYGKLKKDPNGILNLPKGFSYKIISRMGETMSDGFLTPGAPDGMATFDLGNGKLAVIRNHELMPKGKGAFGENNELLGNLSNAKMYDASKVRTCKGGTTTFIYNEKTGKIEKSWLSLAGTLRNCAGGTTPWNSWISCEEVFANKGPKYQKDHGYNFEVPVTSNIQLAEPIPLKAMGRFSHEAVCVDPSTAIVYQTEDQHDSLIYRFLPNVSGKLHQGGRLQALVIKEQKSLDTRNWEAPHNTVLLNEQMEVEWIDVDGTNPREDTLRFRGFKKGAARFARGEGMWFGKGEVYFACTSGGRTKSGQIFKYIPSKFEGTNREKEAPGKLELFLEPNNKDLLKYCDNLTVAPWGDLVLCEDHGNPFIVGVTPKGELYKLAENVGYESEFAGSVFSPSGKTLFVNIQHAGLTIAIEGPWSYS